MVFGDKPVELAIRGRRPVLTVQVDRSFHSVVELPAQDGRFALTVDGQTYSGWRYAMGEHVHIRLVGRTFIVARAQGAAGSGPSGKSSSELRGDMPGTLVAIHAEAGQAVKAGDRLVTIESMKLQLTLVAPRDGVVRQIHLPPNTSFERGALLVSLEPQPAAPKA